MTLKMCEIFATTLCFCFSKLAILFIFICLGEFSNKIPKCFTTFINLGLPVELTTDIIFCLMLDFLGNIILQEKGSVSCFSIDTKLRDRINNCN